jgi:hypothetical protein
MAETPKDWVTLQPNLDPIMVIPNAIIKTIDSVLAFLVTLLNIANIILNVVKVFLVGLLDPIRAIVEAIIEEVRAFIHDLRQLGWYVTGDWNLIQVKPTLRAPELLGGYQSYERRMLKRLLNRKDPGRPDFTSRTAVIGLFAYLSTGDLAALIELINRIKAFFGAMTSPQTAPLAAPTVPEAEFLSSTSILQKPLSQLTGPPDKVTLTWKMPGTGSLFAAPPAGFLVHIGTVPNGFGVRTFRNLQAGDAENVEEPTFQPSVGIDAATGTELRLFGGVSDLSTGSANYGDVEANSPQANKMLLALDANTPMIPPSELVGSGTVPMGGATYFVKVSGFSKAFPGQAYSATFNYDDLPQSISVEADGSGGVTVTGENCYNFYARARPVMDTYVQNLGSANEGTSRAPALVGNTNLKLNNYANEMITDNTKALFKPAPGAYATTPSALVKPEHVGPASAPCVFSMPSAAAMDLVTATTVALEILLMVRIDLTEAVKPDTTEDVRYGSADTYEPGMATGLEGFTDLLANLDIDNIPIFYKQTDPKKWRRQVRKRCKAAAAKMFLEAPSESMAEALNEEVRLLLDFKWSDINSDWPDYTILETVASQDPSWGVASNPTGAGLPDMRRRLKKGPFLYDTSGLWLSRDGIFPPNRLPSGKTLEEQLDLIGRGGAFYMGTGWSDQCPVLFYAYSDTEGASYPLRIKFVRRLLLEYDGGSMLAAVSTVLGVAAAANSRSPTESEWNATRFLDEALAPLDKLLVDIEKFLLAILDGLQGMIDKIIAYIEAIQARIFQIQQLIQMIRALLNSLTMFDLPSFSGLLLVENGTDGITKGLITAGNKPSDSALSYGGGALVVAGGLPAILFEIIELILSGGGDE